NDWQLSGLFSLTSGDRDVANLSYNINGCSVNLTGSPDYGARVIYKSETDDGCSSNQYKQFDTSIISGPTYNSVGLESGRNKLIGCPILRTDLAVARNIRLGKGGRQLQLRADAFNLFNQAAINGRQNQIQYNSPTDQTIRNSQTLADGTNDPNRLKPNQAGFGAANGRVVNQVNGNYQRVIQITVQFQF